MRLRSVAALALLLSSRARGDDRFDAHVALGADGDYKPLATFEPRGILLQGALAVAGRVESASDVPVDRHGTAYDPGVAVSPMARLALRLDTRAALKRVNLAAEYEHDLPTGTWSSGGGGAVGHPDGQPVATELRKGFARLSVGPYLHVAGGFMLNHWGLGLLANDGAHGWEPGSARFTDPRGGDRVLRGLVATGPVTRLGLVALAAVDRVWGDDVLLPGDAALQFVGALSLGQGRPASGGVFVVHRRQESAAGRRLIATVIDLAGRARFPVGKRFTFDVEAEVAVIAGTTTLAPTPEFPEHTLLQVGAAARAGLHATRYGAVIDLAFAGGDGNLDDRAQNAFRADPNFHLGLLLHRQVQAAQTGRAVYTAGDPSLVGVPAPDLDRFPTRGGVSNTIAIFPRLYARPLRGVEIYGGPLVAFTAADVADPLNTRVAGGAARNALDGKPGRYWGTEVDAGARYRLLLRGSEVLLGLEGGVLVPGSALVDATGRTMGMVWGGRGLVQVRL